ncbi:Protein of unknown function [Terribacillus aidingensis]|uniref:DUF4064 domain-containing protein n=1 Tax=Terribacillus aidingensis TaxID=586416 RepID=A0A285P5G9_9BACI|nr:DUF4064 domain-containing protein [Terribacillus aidingensis]SNZ16964.1 Protein of unknown function [Terribacillus aidingensis]
MVKRTAEKVLVIIGAVLFLIVGGWTALGLGSSEETTTNQLTNQGDITQDQAEALSGLMSGVSIWMIIVFVICAILGFVSLTMLKNNKPAKGAGILLIITAVLGTVLSIFTGFISGVLYLIAGIMAIVRKPVEQYNDRGETY